MRKDTFIMKGWKITVLAFKIQNRWCRKLHFFLYRGIGAYDVIQTSCLTIARRIQIATSIHNNSSSQEALLWIIAEFKRSQCILDLASRRNCLFQGHSCRTLFDPTDSSTVVFLHRLLSSSDGFFCLFYFLQI